MPLELSVYRIDKNIKKIDFIPLDFESRLQEILANDISIADPNLMVIGREVKTDYAKRIDILAINRDGGLVVIELKRDRTCRDIVAQLLDYGSWVRGLDNDDIARIYTEYKDKSIDEAFCEYFHVRQIPDELNETHELVIVASELDPATERVVEYLADEYSVQINVIFFRVFKDGDREYLTRAWLREPGKTDVNSPEKVTKGEWNGEYYVSYGASENRDWNEACKYGFISAGGGSWYANTLNLLEKGARIWVNIPGTGYVGVGKVTATVIPIDNFYVTDEKGKKVKFIELPTKGSKHETLVTQPDKAEYIVRVEWIKTVSENESIKEKGFFGNQNSVARPRTLKWEHTVKRLKKRFGVS